MCIECVIKTKAREVPVYLEPISSSNRNRRILIKLGISKPAGLLCQVFHKCIFDSNGQLRCKVIGEMCISVMLVEMAVSSPIVTLFVLVESIIVEFLISDSS